MTKLTLSQHTSNQNLNTDGESGLSVPPATTKKKKPDDIAILIVGLQEMDSEVEKPRRDIRRERGRNKTVSIGFGHGTQ